MSKVQQAKEAQGYEPKPVPPTCMNCRHFNSTTEARTSRWDNTHKWTVESNLRCGIGGFAVKKMASCNRFEVKQKS